MNTNPNKPVLDRIVANYVALVGSTGIYSGIIDWLEGCYISPKSDRARRYSPDTAPWFVEPLEAAASGGHSIVSIQGSVGCGKTECALQFLTYCLANQPGDALWLMSTDADAAEQMESRILPTIKAMPVLEPVLPQSQDNIRKDGLITPVMSLYVAGANMTSTQGKSVRYLVCDETWQFDQGIVTEALARLHGRANGVAIIIGQAGVQGDEAYHLHLRTNQHEYGWTCTCGATQPYKFKQLQYVVTRTADDSLNRMAIADTVRLQCPVCKKLYGENDRHQLVGSYVKMPSNALANHIGFRICALALPHIKWSDLVIQYLEAKERMKNGDDSSMRQFKQKVEAIPWVQKPLEQIQIRTSGYLLRDFQDPAKRAFEDGGRMMAIDTQLKAKFAIIREYSSDLRESKLIAAVELESNDDIIELQEMFKVNPACVWMDASYDTHSIALFAHQRQYQLLRGSGSDSWNIQPPDRRIVINGAPRGDLDPPYKSYVSDIQTMEVQGIHIPYRFFSSRYFRDLLQNKFQDSGFGIPDDVPEKYRQDCTSEHREMRYTTRGLVPIWRLDSHKSCDFADCEKMLLVGLAIGKML